MKGGWLGDTLVTVAIMNNSGGLPGITIFSQSFTTTQPEAWQGLTGLNWDLPTGTYWAAFEAWTPFAQMTMNAPKPLPMYAYTVFYPDIENPTWRQLSNNSICIQVEANPVPLPGTIILLGSGLLGLGGWRGFGKS
jgi:hypothetical protein